jgi:hypothetical protein
MIKLAKFFVNKNCSLEALKDKNLRNLLPFNLTKYMFTKQILPNLMSKLQEKIEEKLQNAHFIYLIGDIWTSKSMSDYLALGVKAIDVNFEYQNLIIGIVRMSGPHNAENIKIAIEDIVNKLKINKEKIAGFITDEGSSLLRLAKPIDDRVDGTEIIDQERIIQTITEVENESLREIYEEDDAGDDDDDDEDDNVTDQDDNDNRSIRSDDESTIISTKTSEFTTILQFFK